MIKRLFVVALIGICTASLAFHFIVEGLGGVEDHYVGRQPHADFHSHDGDQFVLGETEDDRPGQPEIRLLYRSKLTKISQPVAPLLQPPISL